MREHKECDLSTESRKGSDCDTNRKEYDAMRRNPLYAGAEHVCAWEFLHFVWHYHPSVRQFAIQILQREDSMIQYSGDPLVDFTLPNFLEKFVTKKPRVKPATDAIKVLDQQEESGRIYSVVNRIRVALPDALEDSEHFFHRFFNEQTSRMKTHSVKKKHKRNGILEDVFSDIEDDDEDDPHLEAYARELAEGLMQDYDNEDVDMDDWSDPGGDSDTEDSAFDESEIVAKSRNEKKDHEPKGNSVGQKARKSPFASAEGYGSVVQRN